MKHRCFGGENLRTDKSQHDGHLRMNVNTIFLLLYLETSQVWSEGKVYILLMREMRQDVMTRGDLSEGGGGRPGPPGVPV